MHIYDAPEIPKNCWSVYRPLLLKYIFIMQTVASISGLDGYWWNYQYNYLLVSFIIKRLRVCFEKFYETATTAASQMPRSDANTRD